MAFEPVCAGTSGELGMGLEGAGMQRSHGICAEGEAKQLYLRYFLINLSWFVGSFGTLWLDGFIFVQWMWYNKADGDVEDEQV